MAGRMVCAMARFVKMAEATKRLIRRGEEWW